MIRVGVIGAGHWGPNLIRNFYGRLNSRVIWVVDRDPRRLEEVRIRFPEVKVSPDPSVVLDDDTVDAVVIATPTGTHYTIAKTALDRGKHVMVEKPITDNVSQAEELCALAERAHRILMVGHSSSTTEVFGIRTGFITPRNAELQFGLPPPPPAWLPPDPGAPPGEAHPCRPRPHREDRMFPSQEAAQGRYSKPLKCRSLAPPASKKHAQKHVWRRVLDGLICAGPWHTSGRTTGVSRGMEIQSSTLGIACRTAGERCTASALERVARVFHDILDWHGEPLTPAIGPDDVPAWDSLGHMRLISALEEEFGCRFEMDDIMDMTSVGTILRVLQKVSPIPDR